jgi:hypothetical protein
MRMTKEVEVLVKANAKEASMDSDSLNGKRLLSTHLRLRQFIVYCRMNIRAIIKAAALVVVVLELGGIWHEIHQMRSEQVKNALYALPKERRNALRGAAAERLESSSFVNGEVAIDGPVTLDEPVTVEIDQ